MKFEDVRQFFTFFRDVLEVAGREPMTSQQTNTRELAERLCSTLGIDRGAIRSISIDEARHVIVIDAGGRVLPTEFDGWQIEPPAKPR